MRLRRALQRAQLGDPALVEEIIREIDQAAAAHYDWNKTTGNISGNGFFETLKKALAEHRLEQHPLGDAPTIYTSLASYVEYRNEQAFVALPTDVISSLRDIIDQAHSSDERGSGKIIADLWQELAIRQQDKTLIDLVAFSDGYLRVATLGSSEPWTLIAAPPLRMYELSLGARAKCYENIHLEVPPLKANPALELIYLVALDIALDRKKSQMSSDDMPLWPGIQIERRGVAFNWPMLAHRNSQALTILTVGWRLTIQTGAHFLARHDRYRNGQDVIDALAFWYIQSTLDTLQQRSLRVATLLDHSREDWMSMLSQISDAVDGLASESDDAENLRKWANHVLILSAPEYGLSPKVGAMIVSSNQRDSQGRGTKEEVQSKPSQSVSDLRRALIKKMLRVNDAEAEKFMMSMNDLALPFWKIEIPPTVQILAYATRDLLRHHRRRGARVRAGRAGLF